MSDICLAIHTSYTFCIIKVDESLMQVADKYTILPILPSYDKFCRIEFYTIEKYDRNNNIIPGTLLLRLEEYED